MELSVFTSWMWYCLMSGTPDKACFVWGIHAMAPFLTHIGSIIPDQRVLSNIPHRPMANVSMEWSFPISEQPVLRDPRIIEPARARDGMMIRAPDGLARARGSPSSPQ